MDEETPTNFRHNKQSIAFQQPCMVLLRLADPSRAYARQITFASARVQAAVEVDETKQGKSQVEDGASELDLCTTLASELLLGQLVLWKTC
eukprot:3813369-Amphidinium_carterae.1